MAALQTSQLAALAPSSISLERAVAAQSVRTSVPKCGAKLALRATAERPQEQGLLTKIGRGAAALGLAAALQFSPAMLGAAHADEFNVLRSEPPAEAHYFDDAGVLNRVTRSDLKRLLNQLEEETGFSVDVVTLRKVAGKGDVFELADKILENWYPTLELGDKRGVVLLVTSAKEGAVAGGPAFLEAVGDELLEAVCSENLPVLATAEKYNQAMYSTAKRIYLRLKGEPDIGGPSFNDDKRESNYKTKEQTEEKRGQFVFLVGGLLVIAFVVPMAQYYAYVAKK